MVDSKADTAADTTTTENNGKEISKKESSKKDNKRKYILTKFTFLTEMKRIAKYDRKVLEFGSKAFMSFLKVRISVNSSIP